MERLLLVLMFAGCAMNSEFWMFEKPDMTDVQLKLDQNDCFSEALDGTNQQSGGVIRVDRESYRRCMEQRGYTARVSTD